MKISAILARSQNNVIGKNNALPWNLKGDLQRFKEITMGHHVIMGRATFESIGRKLPGRTNVVVSGGLTSPPAEGVQLYSDPLRAINAARDAGEEEAFIIGGSKLYASTQYMWDRLYLTEVQTDIEDGDAFFVDFERASWELVDEIFHAKDRDNDYPWLLRTFDRIR